MKQLLFFTFMMGFQITFAQTTIKVVDAQSGETIPYANIRINDSENAVSNAEGFFAISDSYGDDAKIIVTYLGYVNQMVTVAEARSKQRIAMRPAVFEIENIKVVKPDPMAIMALVRKNLEANYSGTGAPLKTTFFYRRSDAFKPSKFDLEISKSTGFSKQGLNSANGEIEVFTSKMIKYPPLQFTEMLCHFYSGGKKDPKTSISIPKLEVVKATMMKDENRSTDIGDLEDTFGKLILKHLDSTKYYRIRSGWFGSRDTISMRKDFNKKKKKKKTTDTQVAASKSRLQNFMTANSLIHNKELDFVSQYELYDFKYEGAVFSGDELVYLLTFKPRKRKANYIGKLYISQNDFAVIRTEYVLAEGKTLGSLNLKLLLGIKQSENISKGTIIFKKRTEREGYRLQYASKESGQYVYLSRPIKFIELSKEEDDVVAFDLKVEMNIRAKTELLNMSNEVIAETEYDNVKEEEFNFIRLKRYDPTVWKGYGATEPLEEMKRFEVME